MPTVEMLSRDEVMARKAELLAEIGISEADLRRRGEDYSLSAHEAAVLAEIEGLDYLLDA